MDPKSDDSSKGTVRRLQQQQVQIPASDSEVGKGVPVMELQVQIPVSGEEVRKGVNVLTTSNPKNAAPNPFVQGQNKSTSQDHQSNPGTKSEAKNS
jgi:hypothetical protein